MTQKTLVLVERLAHVPEAMRLRQRDPTSVHLVALAPSVMEALTAAGAPYAIPEEFIRPEVLNQRGRENYVYLEQLGYWFETILRELPEPLRLNPVVVHFYRLKPLIDSVSLRVEELLAVCRALRPTKLIVLTSPRDPVWAAAGDYNFLTLNGPIYAAVAPLVSDALGLPMDRRRLRVRCRRRQPSLQQRMHQAIFTARAVGRWLLSWCWRDRARPTLWQVGDQAHDVPNLLEVFSERFAVVEWEGVWRTLTHPWISVLLVGRHPRHFAQALTAFWSRHRTTLAEHPLFVTSRINYFSLLESLLNHLICVGQQRAGRSEVLARRMIQWGQPSAALALSSASYHDTILSLALRKAGIPVMYAQEGGLYGYCHCEMYHYRELAFGDYLLAYGPGAADYVNQTRVTPRQQALALPVGAIRLQRMQQTSISPGRHPIRRVAYIPTNDFNHCLRYAPLTFSDRQYFQIKKHVLEALLAVPDIQIIYKPLKAAWPSDSLRPFLAQHDRRIQVVTWPLPEALDVADAFVLDWPTTSLLEVLTTRKPVAVYMDRDVMQPIDAALPLLHRRARVSVDFPSFLQDLRRGFSESARSGEDLHDTAFLEAYGTGGKAARNHRQLGAIVKLLGHGVERGGHTLADEARNLEPSLVME